MGSIYWHHKRLNKWQTVTTINRSIRLDMLVLTIQSRLKLQILRTTWALNSDQPCGGHWPCRINSGIQGDPLYTGSWGHFVLAASSRCLLLPSLLFSTFPHRVWSSCVCFSFSFFMIHYAPLTCLGLTLRTGWQQRVCVYTCVLECRHVESL